jgi:hypothetical protein
MYADIEARVFAQHLRGFVEPGSRHHDFDGSHDALTIALDTRDVGGVRRTDVIASNDQPNTRFLCRATGYCNEEAHQYEVSQLSQYVFAFHHRHLVILVARVQRGITTKGTKNAKNM